MIAGNFDRVTYSHPTDIAHEIRIPPPNPHGMRILAGSITSLLFCLVVIFCQTS